MAVDCRVAIYIVGELLSRQNIGRYCLTLWFRWVVVHDQVSMRFGRGVFKSIHEQLSITWAYLVRHGTKL